MTYFGINLRAPDGSIEKLGMLPFASLEEVQADVRAAIPDTAADLIRAGNYPFNYTFLICDEDDRLLLEVPLRAALRGDGRLDGQATAPDPR